MSYLLYLRPHEYGKRIRKEKIFVEYYIKLKSSGHSRYTRTRCECINNYPRPPHGPRILRASCISRVMMVTRFAWMAQRFLRIGKHLSSMLRQKASPNSRVFKKMYKVGLCRLLESQKSRALPSKISTIPVICVCSHLHCYFAYLSSPLARRNVEKGATHTTREKGSFWSSKSVLF